MLLVSSHSQKQYHGEPHLSLFNFLFLLFQKSRGYASNVLLGTQQQRPQVLHKLPSIFPIQEASQVDLHHLGIWVLQHTRRKERKKHFAIEIMVHQELVGGRIPQVGIPTF